MIIIKRLVCKFLLIFILVFLFLVNFVIATVTCDIGSFNTTCIINTSQVVSDREIISGIGNLIIESGGSISNDTGGSFTVKIGGDITIQSGGKITANGASCSIERTNCQSGGNLTINTNSLIVFGTLSADGGDNSALLSIGGNGGIVNITTKTLNISGLISVNAGSATFRGNGGDGGHLIITTNVINTLDLSILSANGGNGRPDICEGPFSSTNPGQGHRGNGGTINTTSFDAIIMKGTTTALRGSAGNCDDGLNGTISVFFGRLLDVASAIFKPNATFIPLAINTPPTFDFNLTDQNTAIFEEFVFDINCSDADNDTITFFDNSTEFEINSSTGLIKFTQNTTGILPVKIICSDGMANTSQSFNINIKPTRFVVFGLNSVWLRQGSKTIGNVGARIASQGPVLDSQSEVTVGLNALVTGNIFGDSTKLKSGAIVDGDVRINELINNGQILGNQITPLKLSVEAQIPEFPIFNAGTINITVIGSTNLSLPAGDYENIKLMVGTTSKPTRLILEGGVYNISNLDIGDKTRVECIPVTPATNCEIRIKNRLQPGPNSFIGPSESITLTAQNFKIFVEGINGNTGNLGATPKAAEIGENNVVRATMYVPNGTLLIKQGSEVNGTFIGKDVQIGISVAVIEE